MGLGITAVVFVLMGVAIAFHWFGGFWNDQGNPTKASAAPPSPSAYESESAGAEMDGSLPKLPETSPPPGLPIVAWGKRDHFPTIRNPDYWTAKEGDKALARDEPVLGLVIGSEARAYSTNQLNDHELVVETLAGKPILVTY
jgi:hypothetical protein